MWTFLLLKCIAWKCLWDQREFPGWGDLTPQYTSCCQVSSTGSAGLHSSTLSIVFQMIKCLHALCDGQRSEAHSKPLQPRQSITLAFLISCHWPHCISWCSGGTGSIPWLTFWSQPVVLQIESFQSIKTSKLFWKDFFYLVILRKWRVLIINKAIQEGS